jgi:hypothetical protein
LFIKDHTIRGDNARSFIDLLKKIDENNKFIFAKRATVTFTPLDTEQVKGFLPKETSTPIGEFYKVMKEKRQSDHLQNLTNQLTAIEPDEDELLDQELEPIPPPVVINKDKKRKATETTGKSKKTKSDLKDSVQDIDLDNF